jgi:uncharacterized protein (TIGR03435 family)
MGTAFLYLRTALLAVLLLSSQIKPLAAQDNSPAKLPEFEVATVKPTDTGVTQTMGVKIYPGGRVVILAIPLKALITIAFRASYWQISGGPSWMDKDEYNIEARPPENLQASIRDLRYTLFGIEDEHLREMLQALLIDRFQLKFHRETKTGDVYALERSGKTLLLRPTQIPSASTSASADHFGSIGYAVGKWMLTGYTMPQLAKFASDYYLHAPVMDRTELSGSFDYRQAVADMDPKYGDNSESFLRFMQDVGLKLERSKGPVETFVMDQAAKPSPN